MQVIYKYLLNVVEKQNISLPIGSTILTVQTQIDMKNQNYNIYLWAIIDTDEDIKKDINIYMFGTGMEKDLSINNLKYINTVQLFDGTMVLHIFTDPKIVYTNIKYK